MAGRSKKRILNSNRLRWLFILLTCLSPLTAIGQQLDSMSLDRWKLLRETERYQLQIAEKYYREKNYKVAADEYEKYLSLYERSNAAAYAQLKWSLCQVALRRSNTAIKEGFQSVMDYWPDSDDAVAAAYYIGSTHQGMGRMPDAKRAYRAVLEKYGEHLVAVYSAKGLADIATIEKDEKTILAMNRHLTFQVDRNRTNSKICQTASQQLAVHFFYRAAFDDAVKSLATTYTEGEPLVDHVMSYLRTPLSQLCADSKSAAKGEKLATIAILYFRKQVPTAIDDEAKRVGRKFWLHIAAVHALARHENEVPKIYDQIAKLYGNDDETLTRFAEWYKSQKNYGEARQVYRRFQDKINGLNQVAYSYRQESKIDPAVAAYRQLMGLDQDNPLRWKAEIGATYRSFRKYEEAIATYEQLVTEDVEKEQSWRWQIATAYQDWGKYTEAIANFRQCTNFPENYKNMAWCHRKLKQQKQAILLYNQVATHEPSAPWAILQIGYTQEEAGQKEQAIKTFQVVCKRFPKDGHASQAHAHLQNKYKISVTLGGGKDG
jgi:tetratricopeptide (TPR) repeat protein